MRSITLATLLSVLWLMAGTTRANTVITPDISDDSRAWNAHPTTAYGAFHRVDTRDNAGSTHMVGFVKWNIDLTGITSQEIASATLRGKYSLVEAPADANHKVAVYRITESDWSEDTVTWNDPWSVNGSPGAVEAASATWDESATHWEIEVTDVVKSWAAGAPNYGIYLKQTGHSVAVTKYCSFWTKEAEADQGTYPGAEAMQLTIEIVPTVTLTPGVAEDARTWSSNPTTTYAGFHRVDTRDNNGTTHMFGLVKWNISPGGLTSQDVIAATLRGKYSLVDPPADASHKVAVYRITESDWSEDTVTWNDPWSVNGNPGAVEAASATWDESDTHWEVEVTDMVKSWADGASNYGIYLRQIGNSVAVTKYCSFWSKEAEANQGTYPGAEAMQLTIKRVPPVQGTMVLIR